MGPFVLMVTSLPHLNPNHQTSAGDVDDGIDYEQVVKTALQGVLFTTVGGFPFWRFLSYGFLLLFVPFFFLLLTSSFSWTDDERS